ncbi:RagB/SusD family nutrient uptake outer membrane protein [Pedobacter glucosidilyticus]|uniref:RagB/SusD family nutrient uptake outer membrane protein n=1 Tax=Pedobacter glucosidilyticus TaxID=1122941 RepID=UPI0009DB8E9A|nr:RagB/SusD family nutrient uptake outer membrane protein [Pedobacter glucosidilyticus]
MKKNIIIFGLAFLSLTSCDKMLDVDPKISGRALTDFSFETLQGVRQASVGLYPPVLGVYRNIWQLDVMSDDAHNTVADGLETNSLDNRSGFAYNLWADSYTGISRCNTFLTRVPALQTLPGNETALKNQFLGEAYFLRALHYFNLVRLYGDVPLVTVEPTNVNQLYIPRTPAAQVFAQIESDLLQAISLLPARYPNAAIVQPIAPNIGGHTEVGRATSGAARTLLGHMYLTTGNNIKAEEQLQAVVNSGVYSLNSNYATNFGALPGGTKNGVESIFEAQFAPQGTLAGAQNDFGWQFAPPDELSGGVAGFNRYMPTNKALTLASDLNNTLVESFSTSDLRLNLSVRTNGGTPTVAVSRKFYSQGTGNTSSINWVVYRYADVLLMLAEAQQAQGNKDVQALANLNLVHNHPRTGLAAYVGLTGNALRDAIRLERRLELNLEGKRWFDLLRWGNIVQVMQAHNRPIQANTGGLLPIPRAEMDLNPNLTPNPGYN